MNTSPARQSACASSPERPACTDDFHIRPMRPDEAAVVARHHRVGIPTAFLSHLGNRFLTHLYRAITRSPGGFVFVAADTDDQVAGFISGATNVRLLYRWVLIHRGWLLAVLALPKAVRWSTLRRVFESLRYPSRIDAEYPDAELLSIVVAPHARGTTAAAALLNTLLGEFRRRECPLIRVIVGADLGRANAYYVKHGFRLGGTVSTHGSPSNVYLVETGFTKGPAR